jgi:hypothetical protein
MIAKRLIGAVVAAASMFVPLAGVAWAQPPADPGSNGQGPGDFGGPPGVGTPTVPGVRDFAKQPGSVPEAEGPTACPTGCEVAPGLFTKSSTPGLGQGNGPKFRQ